MSCCAPISSEAAAPELLTRIGAVARHLRVDDPTAQLRELLWETFARPRHDPSYALNSLHPGALPFEWSFSGADPGALRIEMQPFDPALPAIERLRRAIVTLEALVSTRYGSAVAADFVARASRLAARAPAQPRFGAFLGFTLSPHQAPEYKLYVEVAAADPDGSVQGFALPGVEPHFCSLSVRARGQEACLSERTYYACRDGLRLLALEEVCASLGMAHRFPELAARLLELCEGQFYLPPGSVLLGVRRKHGRGELKLELVAGKAMPAADVAGRVQRLMTPDVAQAFRHWSGIIRSAGAHEIRASVVSLRMEAARPSQLSLYCAESGARV